jgi:hypothetical protein
MAKMSRQNKFVVDLGGLKLTDEDRRKLAFAIQTAVLGHLAGKQPVVGQPIQLMDNGGIAGMFIPDPDDPKPPPGYKPPPKKRGSAQ